MDNYVYNLAIRYLISNGISNVMVEDTKSNINEESNDICKEKIKREQTKFISERKNSQV